MTIHISTGEEDYFLHSHEIRQIESTKDDVLIHLITPVGVKHVHIGSKTKVYIGVDEPGETRRKIIKAIVIDENLTMAVKSFQIL